MTVQITDEQLRTDLQYLLECEFESKTGSVLYMQNDEALEQEFSLLIISAYRDPDSPQMEGEYQFLLTRYSGPDNTRGFGELCLVGGDPQMTMDVIPSIEEVIKRLGTRGRERVAYMASGIRDGSLVETA